MFKQFLVPLTKHPPFLRSSGTGTEIGAKKGIFCYYSFERATLSIRMRSILICSTASAQASGFLV
jgi:hypothetical protein